MLTALRHLLGRDVPGAPAAPFLTWYEDGRVELSLTTFDNWVAKTANWLRDELDVQPGDEIRVAVPGWQGVVAAFGVWAVGAVPGDGVAVDTLDVLAYADAYVPLDPPSTPPVEPDPRRVLVTGDAVAPALAALAGGGSVVVARSATAEALARIAEQERAVAADY